MSFWRWTIWSIYFAAWTYGLLTPSPPDPRAVMPWLSSYDYLMAKSLHVCAYAGLAILSGWLHVPCRWRWLLLFVLMAHASATELIQLGIASRHAALQDVGFDHLGIGLGLLLSWKWWANPA